MSDPNEEIADDMERAADLVREKKKKLPTWGHSDVDPDWHSAVAGAEYGDTSELEDLLKTGEITPFARLVLADLIERKISKRRDKPRKAIYDRSEWFVANAVEFVRLRRKRFLQQARVAQTRRDAARFRQLADIDNIIAHAAVAYSVPETTIRNAYGGRHIKPKRKSQSKHSQAVRTYSRF